MDNPPSNFTGTTMQCMSIDGYPQTSPFMLYESVKAKRRPQKATDWSGIKKDNLLKEI
jgi:hypothetical protein